MPGNDCGNLGAAGASEVAGPKTFGQCATVGSSDAPGFRRSVKTERGMIL
jgi:hypothetical protein